MKNLVLCNLTALDKQGNCKKDPTETQGDKVVV